MVELSKSQKSLLKKLSKSDIQVDSSNSELLKTLEDLHFAKYYLVPKPERPNISVMWYKITNKGKIHLENISSSKFSEFRSELLYPIISFLFGFLFNYFVSNFEKIKNFVFEIISKYR